MSHHVFRVIFILIFGCNVINGGGTLNCYSSGAPNSVSGCMADQKELLDTLINMSDPRITPRTSTSGRDRLRVDFGIFQAKMKSLNIATRKLSMELGFTLEWTDSRLTFNSTHVSEFSDLPLSAVWHPSLYIINLASESLLLSKTATVQESVRVFRGNGRVRQWISAQRVLTYCDVDLTQFPYDAHECHIDIGVSVDMNDLIRLHPLDMSSMNNFSMILSTGWSLMNSSLSEVSTPISGAWKLLGEYFSSFTGQDQYSFLRLTLKIYRSSPYYKLLFLFPSLLLGILLCLVFWLPAASREKFWLISFVFLGYLFLLLEIADALPLNTPNVPPLCSLNAFGFALSVVCAFTSGLVANAAHRGARAKRVPMFLRVFSEKLSVFMCVRHVRIPGYKSIDLNKQSMMDHLTFSEEDSTHSVQFSQDTGYLLSSTLGQGVDALQENVDSNELDGSMKAWKNIIKEVKAWNSDTTSRQSKILAEWRFVALILDRLFMFIFALSFVVASLVILL